VKARHGRVPRQVFGHRRSGDVYKVDTVRPDAAFVVPNLKAAQGAGPVIVNGQWFLVRVMFHLLECGAPVAIVKSARIGAVAVFGRQAA